MSAEPHNVFERRFSNCLADLGRATQEAVQFLEDRGVAGQAVYVANLAIEEMATNVLKYGYDDQAVHELRLRLQIHPGTLVLDESGVAAGAREPPGRRSRI